jgi:hypothetical protein
VRGRGHDLDLAADHHVASRAHEDGWMIGNAKVDA